MEVSPHPVPAGLIHSRPATALAQTATLTPRGQRTPAFAPGAPPQPRARPGGSCTVHAHGAAAGPPARGAAARPPPGPPRALSPPAPALPAPAQAVGEAAQERGQSGPARQQAQQPPPEHRARCRRRHGDPPLPLPALENFIDSASADTEPARRRGSGGGGCKDCAAWG